MYYIEDTNVISSATKDDDLSAAAKPGTNRAQLEDKRRELEEQGFQHALTPLLLIEIIYGLANAPSGGSSLDDFVNFNKTKNKLRILYPFHRPLPKMLPHPHAFVLKTVLGVTSPAASRAGNNEESFNRWAGVVLCAQSAEEVWEHGAQVDDGPLQTIDRQSVRESRKKTEAMHREALTAARKGAVNPMLPDEYARRLVTSEGILLPTQHDISKVSSAIEAAYRYHLWLMNQVRLNYKFEKHSSDAVDYSYLLYLADPDVRFLTHDSRIKDRIGDCSQREQIIVMPNLEKPAAGS